VKSMSRTSAKLLDSYTAIDLTDLKGQLCGRILADLGMDVIKIEPAEGDPVRRLKPLWKSLDNKQLSLRFAHLNAGKKSVVLDYQREENYHRLISLVRRADVLIESFAPGFLDSLNLGYRDLSKISPGLVMVSITGFGQTGPRSHFASTDIVAYGMSGLMNIAGNPTLPPCKPPETQAYYFGSLMAALGVVAALFNRERCGTGDWVDISIHEALATQEHIIRLYANEGEILKREGSQHAHVAPAKIFPCQDGYVYLYVSRRHWKKLLEVWPDHPKELDDPLLVADPVRRSKASFVNEHVERFTRRYRKEELTTFLQFHGIPCVPVNKPKEFLADEHVRSRGLINSVVHPDFGEIPLVGPPFLLNGVRPSALSIPQVGEHQEELDKSADVSTRTTSPQPLSVGRSAPLSGLRILSFDQVLAGPYGMTLLAEMGAEIIKIESRQGGLDLFRFFGTSQDPDLSPRFLEFNRNKRSVTVNLKNTEGPDLIKSLVRHCDAVMDNFSVHVMPSLGLDHPSLARIKPEIVTLRMPGLGCTGPKSSYATLGTNITALTGFTYLWNHPNVDNPPVGSQTVWPDYVSGLLAAVLLVAAAIHQKRSAEGTFVDLSQAEVAAYLIGASLMHAHLSDEELHPMGNGCLDVAPQGCYPCRGEDRWCVISIESDSQWQVFVRVIGREELLHDERFTTLQERSKHQCELDSLIAAWTQDRDCYEVMNLLQQHGVPCGVVQNGADLLGDEQLRARHFIIDRENPRLGRIILPGFPIRFANSTVEPSWEFPALGRDNASVFGRILGMTPERVAELEDRGVLK
jgi:crotonobetainyl-CoA:carnitine CoA-transferase CaiB-like acyl-CoA transferase